MTCRETNNLLNAYVDGELDSAGSLSVEKHIQHCEGCLAEMESLRGLASAIENGGLRFNAPRHLRRNVRTAMRASHPAARRSFVRWRWAGAFAAAVIVAIAGSVVMVQQRSAAQENLLVREIIASHVRSMMASHITDVASSDRHTVKPWFGGKLDYSPPVVDLTENGFRLIGGRLDYINGRPIAALVYQRSQHFINLFVWPSDGAAAGPGRELSRQGYNLIHWSKNGMNYWLVSELNVPELNQCAQLLKDQ